MQKARRHGIAPLRPLVSTRFQVLFTPLFGVLFTFPSRYWSTIGLSGVLALPDGAGGFPQDFSGPAVLRIPLCLYSLPVRGSHPYRAVSHLLPVHSTVQYRGPTTPPMP